MTQALYFWRTLLLFALLMVRWYGRQKAPLKSFLFGSLSGVLTLFPASFFLAQAGLPLAINAATLAVSAIFGIPGVVGLSVFCGIFLG